MIPICALPSSASDRQSHAFPLETVVAYLCLLNNKQANVWQYRTVNIPWISYLTHRAKCARVLLLVIPRNHVMSRPVFENRNNARYVHMYEIRSINYYWERLVRNAYLKKKILRFSNTRYSKRLYVFRIFLKWIDYIQMVLFRVCCL